MDTRHDEGRPSGLPLVQRVSAVLWPAFLFAGMATAVFFTAFDPVRLLECEGEPPLGRTGAYSVGFFLFWALCIGSSAATAYFLRPQTPTAPRRESGE